MENSSAIQRIQPSVIQGVDGQYYQVIAPVPVQAPTQAIAHVPPSQVPTHPRIEPNSYSNKTIFQCFIVGGVVIGTLIFAIAILMNTSKPPIIVENKACKALCF